jgi:hypothetical protein
VSEAAINLPVAVQATSCKIGSMPHLGRLIRNPDLASVAAYAYADADGNRLSENVDGKRYPTNSAEQCDSSSPVVRVAPTCTW